MTASPQAYRAAYPKDSQTIVYAISSTTHISRGPRMQAKHPCWLVFVFLRLVMIHSTAHLGPSNLTAVSNSILQDTQPRTSVGFIFAMRTPARTWTSRAPFSTSVPARCLSTTVSFQHYHAHRRFHDTNQHLTPGHRNNGNVGCLSAEAIDTCQTTDTGPLCLRRIDVTGLAPSRLRKVVDFSKPVILSGVISGRDCEDWCEALLEDLQDVEVDFQIRRNADGRSEVFRSCLGDFLTELQEESTHNESWYLLDEHLLDLPEARPELDSTLQGPQALLGVDEFELFFPPAMRPQKHCAIIGGVGARSFLHSDPMEWIGWNVLLEGRKLWTFLPPLPELDMHLDTYRLAPNAFGSHNISAGWQSNVDLYRYGPPDLKDRNRASWSDVSKGQIDEVLQHATSGVQEEGELVLIPPRYWHQVYHLEPSVAVASQYMDEQVRDRIFRHILNWCGSGQEALPRRFHLLTPAEKTSEVLKAALTARFGDVEGLKVFSNL